MKWRRGKGELEGLVALTLNKAVFRGRRLTKLQRLAEMRDEPMHKSYAWFLGKAIARLPNSYTKWDLVPPELGLVETGIEDGFPYALLDNGRKLFAHYSSPKYSFLYLMFSDRLPEFISAETYGAAVDAGKRYKASVGLRYVPEGGTVLEIGAYTGQKAIAFADTVGPQGRVVAVEIMRANHDIFRRNVEANDLAGVLTPVHAAISDRAGEVEVKSQGYQKNTIVDIDGRDFTNRYRVPMRTIDDLIDEHGVERVDYLNVQVNGAEVEALKGLDRNIDRVRVIRVASYYATDGRRLSDDVCRLLEAKGCTIARRSGVNDGNILATTRAGADAL